MTHPTPGRTGTSLKPMAWLSGILCVLCCTIPFIGIAAGSSALAAAAVYFERGAMVFMAATAAFFAVWLFRRRRAPACAIDCRCASGRRAQGEGAFDGR
jgi:hypothetical protein